MSDRTVAVLSGHPAAAHPAAHAWRRLSPASASPTCLTVMQDSRKSTICRLDGVGPGGATVIAKRCSTSAAHVERTIYESVLPKLPVAMVEYHGCAEGDEGWCWLFFENAAGVRLSLQLAEHRQLAARWLATLHTSATHLASVGPLPDRGTRYYLELLRSVRAAVTLGRANPALRHGDEHVLDSILRECDVLEARWSRLEEWCACTPDTVVHGDFQPKNVHVRNEDTCARLLVMDWETAGRGTPAPDLATVRGYETAAVDMRAYCAVARESWPTLEVDSVERLTHAGRVFRRIAAIMWETLRLASPWPEKSVASMGAYRNELAVMSERGGPLWA